jgi:hypothetical protein
MSDEELGDDDVDYDDVRLAHRIRCRILLLMLVFRSSPSLTGKNSETEEGIEVEATAVDVGRMLPQEEKATAKLS